MMELEEAKQFFGKDRFATRTTGIQIEQVGENYSRCLLEVDDRHLAANNQVMGGAIFTLADFAFAVASNDQNHYTVTTASNISYISMAKDNRLIAECRCLKDGKRLCYYETKIQDGTGNLVALVTASGMHIDT